MESFHEYIIEYRKQLEQGAIQKAYRGLIEYMMSLRTHFMKEYPDFAVSGSIYYGYMDMTFFSVFPKPIKDHKLKVPIVFLHGSFRFKVLLSGVNRQVQEKYWELMKNRDWNKYKSVPQVGVWVDSILEHVLVDNPDFSDLTALTYQVEKGTLNFIQDVESFLSGHEN